MDAAKRTPRSTMQYRTDVPTSHTSIYDTPGHSLEEAANDDISGLVESMQERGFDPRCPIIIVVGDYTKERAGWQWNSDDQMEIVQGRHRWLAAIETGLDEVCAIALVIDGAGAETLLARAGYRVPMGVGTDPMILVIRRNPLREVGDA